jgi:hypothetical protein
MLICFKSNKLLQGRGRRREGARRPDGRKKRRSCGGSQRKRTAKRRPQRHRHGYGSRQFRKWHQRQQSRLQAQAAQANLLRAEWRSNRWRLWPCTVVAKAGAAIMLCPERPSGVAVPFIHVR